MDITKKAKEELESRIQKVENFIAHKGLGSSYLERAKKIQRNINLGIVMASVITLAGITVWAINKLDDDD
jgi:Na+-translocating ferredoxin:NAD+ oxidoreductase RnfA subunit